MRTPRLPMPVRLILALSVASALVVAWAPDALSSGQPTIERVAVDRVRPDPALSAACGVSVTAHVQGIVVFRTFPDGQGPAELVTLNLTITATAGTNSYAFRVVGANLTRIEPDGTAVLLATGQEPFAWTGVLKINLTTGDVILEPHHSLEGQLEEACAALTA
jgi:hypothetical protein